MRGGAGHRPPKAKWQAAVSSGSQAAKAFLGELISSGTNLQPGSGQ